MNKKRENLSDKGISYTVSPHLFTLAQTTCIHGNHFTGKKNTIRYQRLKSGISYYQDKKKQNEENDKPVRHR